MRDIRKLKDVKSDEQKELVRRAKTGDIAARNKLIEANMKFIAQKARGYVSEYVPLYDLIVSGMDGVIKAIDKYDESKETKFLTCAGWWIESAIQKTVQKEASHLYHECRVGDQFGDDNGISKETRAYYNAEADYGAGEINNKMHIQRDMITDMFSVLTPREQQVLTMCFGLNDQKECDMGTIAKTIGVTSERVRKIKDFAIHKLRSEAVGKYTEDDI